MLVHLLKTLLSSFQLHPYIKVTGCLTIYIILTGPEEGPPSFQEKSPHKKLSPYKLKKTFLLKTKIKSKGSPYIPDPLPSSVPRDL